MKKITLIAVVSVVAAAAVAAPFALTFDTSNETNGNVAQYGAYAMPTNAGSVYQYKGVCGAAESEIDLDTTNMPSNPCWIAVKASSTNGVDTSAFSVPLLFDTNNIVWPAPAPAPLVPPLNLGAHGL